LQQRKRMQEHVWPYSSGVDDNVRFTSEFQCNGSLNVDTAVGQW